MPDELLRPTIGAGVDVTVRPWRLMSQSYVAFFGGPIASTAIAFLNARRLGVDLAKVRLIVLTGAIGLAAVLAAYEWLGGVAPGIPVPHVAATVIAVVCSLAQQRFQRPMDRAFQLRGVAYRSLWGPGIAAVVGGVAVELLIDYLVDGAL